MYHVLPVQHVCGATAPSQSPPDTTCSTECKECRPMPAHLHAAVVMVAVQQRDPAVREYVLRVDAALHHAVA